MKIGIRQKALFFLLAGPLALIGALAVMLFVTQFNRSLQDSRELLGTRSTAIRDALYVELTRSLALLQSVATNPVTARVIPRMARFPAGLDNDDYQALEEFAALKDVLDYTARNTTIDLMYVASPASSGLILGRDVQLAPGFDVRSRDYYRAALAAPKRFVISEPRVSAEQSAEPIIVITAARTVHDNRDQLMGIACFNYRLTPVIAILREQMARYGVEITFFDTDGRYVLWGETASGEYFYDPANRLPLTGILGPLGVSGQAADTLIETIVTADSHFFDARGEAGSFMVQTLRIPDSRWAIMVRYPRSTVVSAVTGSILPPLVIFLVVFLFGQLVIFILTMRGVVKPLLSVGTRLEALASADADLTVTIPKTTNDEIGQVAVSFNQFVGNLRALMNEVRKAIEGTAAIKQNLSSSTEETSAAIEEISANLQSIQKQIEVLDANINDNITAVTQISRNIGQVDDQIASQAAMVEQSTAAITEMIASLNNVNSIAQNKQKTTMALANIAAEGRTKIVETAATFRTVVSHIQQIQEMATTINNIAAQTNLLSMNAAIEAAHAGDAGRGFAVVAEEIRKLADSAGSSSHTIARLIKDISAAVRDTDKNVENTSRTFESISQEVTSAVNAFTEIEQSVSELNIGGRQILESTNQINEITVHIRDGSREIKAGTGVMQNSSAKIREVSDRVTTGMTEAATGSAEIVRAMQLLVQEAQDLNEIVDDLKQNFGRFRT